jgi:Lon protease-like protein
MPLPLHIFEPRYRRLLRERAGEEIAFGVVLLREGASTSSRAPVYDVGTAAALSSRRTLPDGRSDIVVSGRRRFQIRDLDWSTDLLVADIEWLPELVGDIARAEALLQVAGRKFARYVAGITTITGRSFTGVRIGSEPSEAAYDLVTRLPLHTWERQRLLELPSAEARLDAVVELVERENALLYQAGAAGLVINHPGERFSAN